MCTLVQALRFCTSHTSRRGSRSISLLFLVHDIWSEWGVSFTPRTLFTPGKHMIPTLHEACWAPWPVWTIANISHHRYSITGSSNPIASHYTHWATLPTSKCISVNIYAIKMYSFPITVPEWPRGFQEFKFPRFYLKSTGWWQVYQFQTPAFFTPGNAPGSHFCIYAIR